MDKAINATTKTAEPNQIQIIWKDLLILGLSLILALVLPYLLRQMWMQHCQKKKENQKMSNRQKAQLINQGADKLKERIMSLELARTGSKIN